MGCGGGGGELLSSSSCVGSYVLPPNAVLALIRPSSVKNDVNVGSINSSGGSVALVLVVFGWRGREEKGEGRVAWICVMLAVVLVLRTFVCVAFGCDALCVDV